MISYCHWVNIQELGLWFDLEKIVILRKLSLVDMNFLLLVLELLVEYRHIHSINPKYTSLKD